MGLPMEFAYFFWVLFFGAFWALFYAVKPAVRHEMLIISVIAGVAGIFAEYFFTADYWHPMTLTGTRIGFEDFFLAFFYGGVGAAAYEVLFFRQPNRSSRAGNPVAGLWVIAVGFMLLYLGVFHLAWNSMHVAIGVLLFIGSSMILYLPHLFKHGLYSGLVFLAISSLCIFIFDALYPGVFASWWNLEELSGATVGNVPLEEFLFAFAWGFAVGPASELVGRMKFKLV